MDKLKYILKSPNFSGYKSYNPTFSLLAICHSILITEHVKRADIFARLKWITKCLSIAVNNFVAN